LELKLQFLGTTIKKENLAATSLSIPRKIEVPIVVPLLEIPEKME